MKVFSVDLVNNISREIARCHSPIMRARCSRSAGRVCGKQQFATCRIPRYVANSCDKRLRLFQIAGIEPLGELNGSPHLRIVALRAAMETVPHGQQHLLPKLVLTARTIGVTFQARSSARGCSHHDSHYDLPP